MNLYGLTLTQLESLVVERGLPKYRARQIAEWLYHHHVESVDQMTNLPADLRAVVGSPAADAAHTGQPSANSPPWTIESPPAEEVGVSSDGTKKHLWTAFSGDIYESALIPDGDRVTFCVSSQSGCRIGCKFCLTARKGLRQNLSPAEILGQYRNLPDRKQVTGFVFMGMGEPLDNIDPVLATLEILTSDWGYGFSPRRVTVSSIGMLPELERLLDETDVNVAISLHAARREERLPLVPSENRHPIVKTVELLKERARSQRAPFTGTGRRKVSFEITMLKGVNDSVEQAGAVRNLIKGIPARVNLIPWNTFPEAPYEPSPRESIEAYQAVLKKAGITTTIRESRGQDVGAACGLLAGRREPA